MIVIKGKRADSNPAWGGSSPSTIMPSCVNGYSAGLLTRAIWVRIPVVASFIICVGLWCKGSTEDCKPSSPGSIPGRPIKHTSAILTGFQKFYTFN